MRAQYLQYIYMCSSAVLDQKYFVFLVMEKLV